MALINYLTRIHFADSVLEDALAEELRQLGVSRPLIVTDAEGRDPDALGRVADALLPHGGISVWVSPIGSERNAELWRIRAVFAARNRDSYIGLGGTCALGLARQSAYACAGTCQQGAAAPDADLPARGRHVPVIAIPTTTTCVGLVPLDPAFFGQVHGRPAAPAMLPDVVLCDPTLTLHADSRATAAAGMDALIHCIEAYLDTTWNPPADGMALDGVRRACAYLERAVRDGSDLEARRELLTAALDAGLASQKGSGAIHALARAIEHELGPAIQHGYLHAALLPVVLAFNGPAIGARLAALRHALQDTDICGAIAELATRISLPVNLSSLQLDAPARNRIACLAADDPANQTNPRHATAADYVRMLEDAG